MSAATSKEGASLDGSGDPLSLQRYAAICALLDVGRRRDEVLERARLSPERWTAEQESWLHRMADQARRQRFELQRRFNDYYLERLQALAAGRAIEIAEGVELDDGRAVEPSEAVVSSRRARVVEEAAPPSVRASVPPPGLTAAPSAAPGPPAAPAPPPSPLPPPAVSPPGAVAVPDHASPPPPSPGGDGVLPFAGARPDACPPPRRSEQAGGPPVLPFSTPGSDDAAPAPPGHSPPRPPARAGTMAFEALPDNQDGAPALPFEGASNSPGGSGPRRAPPPPDPRVMPFAPKAEAPAPRATTQPPEARAPAPKRNPLSSTMAFDGGALGPSLPFAALAGSTSGRAPSPVDDGVLPFHAIEKAAQGPSVSTTAAASPAEALAGTMMIDDGQGAEGPRLTLEQFASLTAEVARAPAQREAIERRYGLDAAAHDAEKRAWAMKFLDEPRLAEDYRTKVKTYRDWLDERGS